MSKTVKSVEVHTTPANVIPVTGDRRLWVLDVDGEEVRVIVTAGPTAFKMEAATGDAETAAAALAFVARHREGITS